MLAPEDVVGASNALLVAVAALTTGREGKVPTELDEMVARAYDARDRFIEQARRDLA